MKKRVTFIVILLISISLLAQTQVSGDQSGTWTAANSPYDVVGDITVPAGEVLNIEAGVEVKFQGHYKLDVLGQLDAIGTETDNIFLTTDDQATGWGGIALGQSIGGIITPADDVSNFSYCRFEYGKTSSDAEYPYCNGGVVRLISSDAVFANCIFADNSSATSNPGLGGAVYALNTGDGTEALTFFTDCKFLRNEAYGEGGAISFTSDFNTEITGCEFTDNTVSYGGGAITFYSVVDTKITKCLFVNNTTYYSNGGAIYTSGVINNSLYFTNCTMVGNETGSGSGGAVALYYGHADFVNCIIVDNTSLYDDDNVYVDAGSGSATVNYCNMPFPEYNTEGNNNIDVDPLFVDANNDDYHLQELSPCVNAGTDVGLDYIGDAPDMGCFEWEEVGSENEQIIENYREIKNYPNPFNPSTTINFSIEKNSNVEIAFFNIKGQKIKSLVNRTLESGNHSIIWNGKNESGINLSSGIYYYKLIVNGKTEVVKKCLLLK